MKPKNYHAKCFLIAKLFFLECYLRQCYQTIFGNIRIIGFIFYVSGSVIAEFLGAPQRKRIS